jgi:alkanesulfonate monooxygenase SsuD/methylene tetrahydromethanopterin reductase-like flavin-dependent oxidoreductase (luciferase family)
MARLMDRLGYDTFWMAEHHFQHEGYECIPNLLTMAVHLAHLTRNINIGCGFNITPMWHPLRLAEDYAVADILTGGRVVFGVGRGYHTREVETFGSPLLDQPANRELFEEQVQIIFKAFNEESFSHKGKYYTLPPKVPYRGYTLEELTLVPRPLRRPVMLAADPGGHGARHRVHGEYGHQGPDRRWRRGGRRHAQPRAGMATSARRDRHAPRAGRGAVHRFPLLHRRKPRAGHPGGGEILRREHENVR